MFLSTMIELVRDNPDWRKAELPTLLAATWGAFLHEGMMDAPPENREQVILDQWRAGCIELMDDACDLLPLIWEMARDEWDAANKLGIFEYSVVSKFGEYVGDYIMHHNGDLPDEATAKAKIRELLDAYYFFMSENDPANAFGRYGALR